MNIAEINLKLKIRLRRDLLNNSWCPIEHSRRVVVQCSTSGICDNIRLFSWLANLRKRCTSYTFPRVLVDVILCICFYHYAISSLN